MKITIRKPEPADPIFSYEGDADGLAQVEAWMRGRIEDEASDWCDLIPPVPLRRGLTRAYPRRDPRTT